MRRREAPSICLLPSLSFTKIYGYSALAISSYEWNSSISSEKGGLCLPDVHVTIIYLSILQHFAMLTVCVVLSLRSSIPGRYALGPGAESVLRG